MDIRLPEGHLQPSTRRVPGSGLNGARLQARPLTSNLLPQKPSRTVEKLNDRSRFLEFLKAKPSRTEDHRGLAGQEIHSHVGNIAATRRPVSQLTALKKEDSLIAKKITELADAPLLPAIPKQWRHLALASLFFLLSVAGVGTVNQVGDSSARAASELSGTSLSQAPIALSFPKINSVELPPVPTKNPEARSLILPAAHAILIDTASKIPLYEKAADEPIAIASTTKIATALVALGHYQLSDRITISKTAASINGSVVNLKAGETATVEQLLYGMMLVSGNDAALALAEHMALPGDPTPTSRFIDQMNELGTKVGMKRTLFKHPAGLDDTAYSTANDMARLFDYGLSDPTFAKIVGTVDYEYTSPQNFIHTFKNSNRLITQEMYYPGMIGGKTGFTPDTPEGGAGHCLIVAAVRDGHRVIAGVFNTASSKPEASALTARQLLDYGFNNFTWQKLSR